MWACACVCVWAITCLCICLYNDLWYLCVYMCVCVHTHEYPCMLMWRTHVLATERHKVSSVPRIVCQFLKAILTLTITITLFHFNRCFVLRRRFGWITREAETQHCARLLEWVWNNGTCQNWKTFYSRRLNQWWPEIIGFIESPTQTG